VVPLTLIHRQNRISCYAIIDSGADFCTFPLVFAVHLGLDPRQARRFSTAGIGSLSVPAFLWDVTIDLRGIAQFPLQAGFSQGLDHLGGGLLGQRGFFERFKVAFDLPKEVFQIEVEG
jgi:hypothetical protein